MLLCSSPFFGPLYSISIHSYTLLISSVRSLYHFKSLQWISAPDTPSKKRNGIPGLCSSKMISERPCILDNSIKKTGEIKLKFRIYTRMLRAILISFRDNIHLNHINKFTTFKAITDHYSTSLLLSSKSCSVTIPIKDQFTYPATRDIQCRSALISTNYCGEISFRVLLRQLTPFSFWFFSYWL